MTLKEPGSSPETTKLFWWPCPSCRLWHQTRLASELLEGNSVEVRCPVNGRAVERPVTHKRPRGEVYVPAAKRGIFSRLFGRRRST